MSWLYSLRETVEVAEEKLREIPAMWWNGNIADEDRIKKRGDITIKSWKDYDGSSGDVNTTSGIHWSGTTSLLHGKGEAEMLYVFLVLIQSGLCSCRLSRMNIMGQISVDCNKAETLFGFLPFIDFQGQMQLTFLCPLLFVLRERFHLHNERILWRNPGCFHRSLLQQERQSYPHLPLCQAQSTPTGYGLAKGAFLLWCMFLFIDSDYS